ncbi:hypothetical protein K7X08_030426 [Anisodus acutangulus]|uniref:Uncharacterized protein n=1 Tax=Anisodus acutangulus TaxID=402998 RepID=A0A9Q1L4H4_9SOLA|nr:hypothetical protein K7X08_030426 [Anisodus acutangulus]
MHQSMGKRSKFIAPPKISHRKGNGTGTKQLDGLTKHGDGISPSSGTDPATVNLKIKAIDEVVQVAGRPSSVKGKAAQAKVQIGERMTVTQSPVNVGTQSWADEVEQVDTTEGKTTETMTSVWDNFDKSKVCQKYDHNEEVCRRNNKVVKNQPIAPQNQHVDHGQGKAKDKVTEMNDVHGHSVDVGARQGVKQYNQAERGGDWRKQQHYSWQGQRYKRGYRNTNTSGVQMGEKGNCSIPVANTFQPLRKDDTSKETAKTGRGGQQSPPEDS